MSEIKSFRIYWALIGWTEIVRGTTIVDAIVKAGYNPDSLSPNDIVVEGEEERIELKADKTGYVDNSKSYRWDVPTRAWIKIQRPAAAGS